jgi:hypothetical protein
MSIFSLFVRIILLFLVFCPGIMCAYMLLDGIKSYGGNLEGWNYFWAMTGIVYLIECVILFFKGWAEGLKEKRRQLWIIPWSIGVVYCFLFPSLLLHTFIFNLFRPAPGHPTGTLKVISWVLGVSFSTYIYYRYERRSDWAFLLTSWAYRIGQRLSNPAKDTLKKR